MRWRRDRPIPAIPARFLKPRPVVARKQPALTVFRHNSTNDERDESTPQISSLGPRAGLADDAWHGRLRGGPLAGSRCGDRADLGQLVYVLSLSARLSDRRALTVAKALGAGRGGRFGPGAPDALPGRYTIRVIVEGDTVSGSVSVEADPRFDYSTAARREKLAAQRRAIGLQEVAFEALDRLRRAESGISTVLERIEDDSSLAALHAVGDSLTEQLKEVRQEFTGVPPRQGFRRNANTVNSALNQAYSQLSSSWGAPTETELTFLRRAESRLEAVLGPVNDVLLLVEDYRQRVESAGVEMFDRVDSITMDWRPAIDDSR